ncbi:uncharacterized protein LOC135955503 [Calliphora vicina]|uniref:uncharacterized protein LOC135955503 n=1 Tax=Calliphora vicina TaxID=7373 RepID=UPI00325A5596
MEEAYRSASRLPGISHVMSGDLVGHMRILGIFENYPSIAISDHMSPTLVLDRKFRVLIPERDVWLNQTWRQNNADQVWFTDGSKQANGDTGAGIYGPNFQRCIPMGTFSSIFQTEIYAILICSNECLRRRLRNNIIFVMSDSQAALRALSSCEVRSGVVMNCWTSLNELSAHNELTLCWVPGHEGHAGNERADCLANRGARRSFIGPEPFFGIPRGYTMERIRFWVESEFARFWGNLPGLKQSQRFITLSRRRSQSMLSLGKGLQSDFETNEFNEGPTQHLLPFLTSYPDKYEDEAFVPLSSSDHCIIFASFLLSVKFHEHLRNVLLS